MTGQDMLDLIERGGISQREFCELIGVSPQTLQNWAARKKLTGTAETLLLVLNEMPDYVATLRRLRGSTGKRPRRGRPPKDKGGDEQSARAS